MHPLVSIYREESWTARLCSHSAAAYIKYALTKATPQRVTYAQAVRSHTRTI